MSDEVKKYTFTFDYEEEGRFSDILSRLEPTDYTVIEPVTLVKPEDGRYSARQTVMEMDSYSAQTFRLGMKNVKIRRERTEEELAEEKSVIDSHIIKVRVQVPGLKDDV